MKTNLKAKVGAKIGQLSDKHDPTGMIGGIIIIIAGHAGLGTILAVSIHLLTMIH